MEYEYKLWTMADIARLPKGSLDKFYKELPHIVEALRPLIALAETLNGERLTPLKEEEVFGGSKWVDDELGKLTSTVTVDGETILQIERAMSK